MVVVVGVVVTVAAALVVVVVVVMGGMVVVVVANGLRSRTAPRSGTKSKQVLRHRLPTNSVWISHRYLVRLLDMRSLSSGIRTVKLLREAFDVLTANRRRSGRLDRSLNKSPLSRVPVERTSA